MRNVKVRCRVLSRPIFCPRSVVRDKRSAVTRAWGNAGLLLRVRREGRMRPFSERPGQLYCTPLEKYWARWLHLIMGPSNTHPKDKEVEVWGPTGGKKTKIYWSICRFLFFTSFKQSPGSISWFWLIDPLPLGCTHTTVYHSVRISNPLAEYGHNQMWVNESLHQTQLQDNNTMSYVGKITQVERYGPAQRITGVATQSGVRWECSLLIISHFWL